MLGLFSRSKKNISEEAEGRREPDLADDVLAAPSIPSKHKLMAMQRALESLHIGSRVLLIPEFRPDLKLDNIVIGLCIDDIFVFSPEDLQFDALEQSYVIRDGIHGDRVLSRIESCALVVPMDSGAEGKLDYDSRAALGDGGLYRRHSWLSVASNNASAGNVQLEAEIVRRTQLKSGMHAGHKVALLELALGTLAEYDPRAQARIDTKLPATLCRNGTDTIIPAVILDVSEQFLRVRLDPSDHQWPRFSERHHALITLKPTTGASVLKLKCRQAHIRGDARVFEIKAKIDGAIEHPFTGIDAMELKIQLMGSQS